MKKVLFLFSFIAILFIVTGCESKDEKKFYGCDDCVFARYTETKKIGDELTEYEKDYKALKHDYFLGHKIDKNNKITAGYLCGVEDGKLFCVEGNYKTSKYEDNKTILNKVFKEEECQEDKDEQIYTCTGNVHISINNEDKDGTNLIGLSKSDQCYIKANGSMYCYFTENED